MTTAYKYLLTGARLLLAVIIATTSTILPQRVHALPTEHYVSNSVLSEGKWRKVTVGEDGMYFISNADLRSMGFPDPSKVNVYGYGGRMEPEALSVTMGDDLPIQPVARTASGIVFFATSYVAWKPSSDNTTAYSHTQNPYSESSCYFLSDRDISAVAERVSPAMPANSSGASTTFICRLVHEKDLAAPAETGRVLLGEDFRSATSQRFNFKLPDNTGADISVKTCFGANITGGSATLRFTANGNQLPSTTSDRIAGATSNQFLRTTTTVKKISDAGETLAFGIESSCAGAIMTARLDYIEVEYERHLRLSGGEIYFYGNFGGGKTLAVSGCSASTVIWDVTDPAKISVVDYNLEGDKACFMTEGYREFVAFEPSKVTRKVSSSTAVANQDLHGMAVPDMVIISPDQFLSAARRIALLHEETDGFIVHVVTPSQIYNEFSSGTADVGAFRKMLKHWYDKGAASDGGRLRYCLIFGRPSYDNKNVTATVKMAGYPRVPIWQSDTGFSESISYSTDDYIAMLDDCEEEYFDISTAKLRVAVGRLPVTSVSEADDMASKLERYIKKPAYGAWRNNVTLIADDQDNGQHLDQAEDAYRLMRGSGNGEAFAYERLYLDAYPISYTATGAAYPQAREKLLKKFNDSNYIHYIGHASTTSWTHEGVLTWTDIQNISNTNLPFLYAATCSFGQWDADAVSGGERLVLHPESGMIGMIAPSRTVYITLNGLLGNSTASGVFTRDPEGKGRRFGDIYVAGKNNLGMADTNKLRYCLISDPALRLQSPELEVAVLSVAGHDVASEGAEAPVVGAMETFDITGEIRNSDGSVASDFNGYLDLTLFDAERPIETYGNGSSGKVAIYNDRKNTLQKARGIVKDGCWTARIMMPSEIDNNYSPALISCYAWSDALGQEANGSTDNLYVFGYVGDSERTDTEGPIISEFYLNRSDFRDGTIVNSTPVAYAAFSDESGINISDNSLGHKITLRLDNKTIFDDVSLYYSPEPDDSRSGRFAYPIEEMSPGEHTLLLTIWDNANNCSQRELRFNVGVTNSPTIYDVRPDVNPASTSVAFTIHTDRPMTRLTAQIEVFDLSGRKIWSASRSSSSGMESVVSASWNLCDASGERVRRGIYLYRATVTTPEGTFSTVARKLAVTAP